MSEALIKELREVAKEESATHIMQDIYCGQLLEAAADEIERLSAKQAGDDGYGEAVYLRDVDGTGSMHVCSKGDPGAVRYVPD